jgi:ribosomal protein S18 acetylase RimI-like enzyme
MTPRRLTLADLAAIERLHERCADFWELVEGALPDAGELMHELPPGVALADKHVLGVEDHGELTALIDFVEGYPEPHAWHLGLLVVAPEARGSGLGAELYAHAEDFMCTRGGAAVRLIVQEQNPRALAFWTRRGFVFEATTTQKIGRPNVVTRLVKPLR